MSPREPRQKWTLSFAFPKWSLRAEGYFLEVQRVPCRMRRNSCHEDYANHALVEVLSLGLGTRVVDCWKLGGLHDLYTLARLE